MEENEDAIAEALAKDMHKVFMKYRKSSIKPPLSNKPPPSNKPPFLGEES